MKKVLIISGNNHMCTSGVDMYSKRLISILKKQNCHVDEYSFEINMQKEDFEKKPDIEIISPNKSKNFYNKIKIKWWIKNIYNVIYRSRKQLNNLIDDYDLVIDSTLMLVRSKKVMNNEKYLYIQHQNADFFEMRRYGFFRLFALFVLKITGFKNNFKEARNIVFFDEPNKEYFQRHFKNNEGKKYFTIMNSCIDRKTIEENKIIKDQIYKDNKFSHNVIYIGRITVEQKRMNDVKHVLKKTKNKLDVWGFGTYTKYFKKSHNVRYHGRLEHSKVINTLMHSKISSLWSDYEGFSTSMVESICSMTPILVRNSHLSAVFLTNENKNGILLDNKFNLKEYRRVFDEINELSIETLKEMSENCYKFAIENLLYETFEKKWIDVYKEMTENIL